MEKKEKFRYLNRIPLFAQLIVLMAILTTLLILSIYGCVYKNTRHLIKTQLNITYDKLIRMELSNLEEYINTLTNFCIQPCYDGTFYTIIQSSQNPEPDELDYMKLQMKYYYFSMEDIKEYHLYLVNPDIDLYRDPVTGRFLEQNGSAFTNVPEYRNCIGSNKSSGIYPTQSTDTFLTYYYTMVRNDDHSPQAVVSVTVDNSFISTLRDNHADNGEIFCITNSENQLLYSSNPTLITSTSVLSNLLPKPYEDFGTVKIHNKSYIANLVKSPSYGLKIVSFLPVSYVNSCSHQVLTSSLVIGISLFLAMCILLLVLIRLATSPLSTLANRLDTVSTGDYSSKLSINGSSEITRLCNSFNLMIEHIDQLMKDNYIEELNQKSSLMKILNLQMNPHFVYHAIHDIATEAANTNEPKLLHMASCLSNILGFMNSNGDFATISDELVYLQDYLFLKEVHLEEPIALACKIPASLSSAAVPKLTLQILTYPLFQNGVRSKDTPIELSLSIQPVQESLCIQLHAQGYSLLDEYIHQFQESILQIASHPQEIHGDALLNLYYRLHLIYNGQFALNIDSIEDQYTAIQLTIPIMNTLETL